jgi:DegV family protein with EDD domain
MKTDSHHPKTSQPTPGDFKKIYNFISSHYNSIISIHLSKKMSGTYQSGINASKSVKIDNIQIIDSYSASVGLGLLATYAVDLKQSGKKYKEIVKKIQDHREKTQVFLMLKDLDYIVKGGRLPSKIKTLANLLRLRPVLGSKKGKLTARGVLYGHRNRVEKFVNFLSKKINPEKKYHIMIAHANDYENGEKLLKLLIHNHSNILKHHLLELGGALGAHAGPGGLAVGIQERK